MENNDRIGEFPADNEVVCPEDLENPGENPEEDGLTAKMSELEDSLVTEKIKVALLIGGVMAEKLDEACGLSRGLLGAGKSIEDAAAEICGAYPHFKAAKREIPQFAAASSGASDGFSAIRKIFSGK